MFTTFCFVFLVRDFLFRYSPGLYSRSEAAAFIPLETYLAPLWIWASNILFIYKCGGFNQVDFKRDRVCVWGALDRSEVVAFADVSHEGSMLTHISG